MKKILLFGMMLVLLTVAVRADFDYNIARQYNLTQLPVTDYVELNFTLQPNATVYFNEVQFDNITSLTFPASITIPANETVANFILNYTVPFFGGYTGNSTLFENIIAVTNTVNTNLVLLKLQFLIEHPRIEANETNITEPYIEVLDEGKLVQVQTFSALDFNRSHPIEIRAPNGSEVNVTCGQFISCFSPIVMPSDTDELLYYVDIAVPQGTLPTTYNSYVLFKIGNQTANIDFEIIVEGGDLYNVILYDVWDRDCYDSPEQLAECYKQQSRYNAEIAQQLLEELETRETVCTKEVEETIKYVEVGNIDPELLDSYDDLRKDYDTLSTDYSTLSLKYTACVEQKDEISKQVTTETAELSNEYILRRNALEKEMQDETREAKEQVRRIFNWILGVLTIGSLIVLLGGAYAESQWVVRNFPKKWMFILFLFFLILWIIVGVWLR